MTETLPISRHTLGTLLALSVRYALTRSSYVVPLVAGILRDRAVDLLDSDLHQSRKDIVTAMERTAFAGADLAEWTAALRVVEAEIERRTA